MGHRLLSVAYQAEMVHFMLFVILADYMIFHVICHLLY